MKELLITILLYLYCFIQFYFLFVSRIIKNKNKFKNQSNLMDIVTIIHLKVFVFFIIFLCNSFSHIYFKKLK